jgi:hypothetical protein
VIDALQQAYASGLKPWVMRGSPTSTTHITVVDHQMYRSLHDLLCELWQPLSCREPHLMVRRDVVRPATGAAKTDRSPAGATICARSSSPRWAALVRAAAGGASSGAVCNWRASWSISAWTRTAAAHLRALEPMASDRIGPRPPPLAGIVEQLRRNPHHLVEHGSSAPLAAQPGCAMRME